MRHNYFVVTLVALSLLNVMTEANKVCQRGPPGLNGQQGIPGRDGRDGRDGKWTPGASGPPGLKGDRGPPGIPGQSPVINWKQCAWKKSEDKDNGLIKECIFRKKQTSTALRVFYGGNLRIDCQNCCKRWYFTFNGAECQGPLPIDGIFYTRIHNDIHRHRHIEGYCTNIPAGQVRVGFWVGNCKGQGRNADAHSGWNSVSRIVIEEVPPQQT
ncbi:collagen triple helix repeat-containing protein 1 [Exaiptasia diaphana]|uniref:CTHRC1 C-terminal domain-containing protein n=1 Tax=Exaiptasia diaphana TaxID=2652724 RepID=A0A913X9B4_EXADI|nr:collagen triple helix repeat-containing protein 1 [Exaiptasia diaphana]KXJ13864.1 Collagen triple helix repeat-containing protein 1 [Exaiptasia diaphana]